MPPPQPTPLLTTGLVFTVSSTATIHAPPAAIWSALTDTSTWPAWSTFVPSVSILSQPPGTAASSPLLVKDTRMKFTVRMSSAMHTSSVERVTSLSPPPAPDDAAPPGTEYTVCWAFDAFAPGLRAERVNVITVTGEAGVCEYRTWETFAGPTAWVVRLGEGTLQGRFEDWARDLKAYCERGAEGGGGK